MTADFFHFDMEFLGRVANRIVNEVRGINRVVYDVTSPSPRHHRVGVTGRTLSGGGGEVGSSPAMTVWGVREARSAAVIPGRGRPPHAAPAGRRARTMGGA
jgi:hypothetical protein